MRKSCLLVLTALCALIVAASFLPWATFKAQLPSGAFDGEGAAMKRALEAAMTIHGWNGHVTFFGLTLPNWLVPIGAVAVAVLAWLRATEKLETSPHLGTALCAYAVAHLVILLVVLVANPDRTRIGAGALLAFAASLGALLVSLFSWWTRDQDEYVPPPVRPSSTFHHGPTPPSRAYPTMGPR